MRADRKKVVTALVFVAVAAQVAFAGVASLLSVQTREGLESERLRLDAAERAFSREAESSGDAEVRVCQQQLLSERDVAGTMQVLQAIGDTCAIALTRNEAVPARTEGKQAFEVAGVAAAAVVCELIAKMEQHPRLLVVESGRLEPAEGGLVAFELAIATWHTEDLR